MKRIWADSESAGVVDAELRKAGLEEEFEVRYHPYCPQGIIMVSGGQAVTMMLALNAIGGIGTVLRVLDPWEEGSSDDPA